MYFFWASRASMMLSEAVTTCWDHLYVQGIILWTSYLISQFLLDRKSDREGLRKTDTPNISIIATVDYADVHPLNTPFLTPDHCPNNVTKDIKVKNYKTATYIPWELSKYLFLEQFLMSHLSVFRSSVFITSFSVCSWPRKKQTDEVHCLMRFMGMAVNSKPGGCTCAYMSNKETSLN